MYIVYNVRRLSCIHTGGKIPTPTGAACGHSFANKFLICKGVGYTLILTADAAEFPLTPRSISGINVEGVFCFCFVEPLPPFGTFHFISVHGTNVSRPEAFYI